MSKTTDSPVNVYTRLERALTEKQGAEFDYIRQETKEEDFAEIGTGIMEIQDIISCANEIGAADYIILEQDYTSMSDEIESIKASMAAFRRFEGIDWE